MTSHQARNAQLRQTVRSVLASLKNVSLQSIPYPRSNVRLSEYRVEIEAIRGTQAEFNRLGAIDPHPHYEIVFNRREQVKVGVEITDSNHIADIPIGTPGEHDQIELINANGDVIKQILQEERQRLGPIKVRLGIFGTMRRITDYQQGLFEEILAPIDDSSHTYRYGIPFKTRNMPVLPSTNIDNTLTFGLMHFTEKIDTYSSRGSGWEFYRVEKVFIEVTQFMPPTGESHISLSADLSAKKEVVNPQNKDNECFRWAILSALHPTPHHPERIAQYQQYYDTLNFKDIKFPVQADEIVLQRFERQNPSIALCISEWKGKLSPVYVTDKEIAEGRQMIDLLLISNGERQHYCWIKNISRLVSQRTKNCNATLICRWYISHFTHLQSEHDKHMAMCRRIKHSPQADSMPNPKKGEDIFKFKNWKRCMQVPYYFIADFEAMPITLPSQVLEALKKTKKIQEHIPAH